MPHCSDFVHNLVLKLFFLFPRQINLFLEMSVRMLGEDWMMKIVVQQSGKVNLFLKTGNKLLHW